MYRRHPTKNASPTATVLLILLAKQRQSNPLLIFTPLRGWATPHSFPGPGIRGRKQTVLHDAFNLTVLYQPPH